MSQGCILSASLPQTAMGEGSRLNIVKSTVKERRAVASCVETLDMNVDFALGDHLITSNTWRITKIFLKMQLGSVKLYLPRRCFEINAHRV